MSDYDYSIWDAQSREELIDRIEWASRLLQPQHPSPGVIDDAVNVLQWGKTLADEAAEAARKGAGS